MAFTMQDFMREFAIEHFAQIQEAIKSLPPEKREGILEAFAPQERRRLIDSLPPEERLAGLSPKQIQQYLEKLTAKQSATPRKQRRKK